MHYSIDNANQKHGVFYTMNKFLQLLIIPFLIILLSGCGSSDSKKPVNGNTDSVISKTDNSTNNGFNC